MPCTVKTRKPKTTWQWIGLATELVLLVGVVWCATYDAWLGGLTFVVWSFLFFGTFVWLGQDMDALLSRGTHNDTDPRRNASATTQHNPDLVGRTTETITPLQPIGKIRIDDVHYQARCDLGYVNAGTIVRVTGATESELVVEPVHNGS